MNQVGSAVRNRTVCMRFPEVQLIDFVVVAVVVAAAVVNYRRG